MFVNIEYDYINLPEDFPFVLSDMDLKPLYSMGEKFHWHDCFEISYANSGSGVYEIENQKYPIEKGELIIVNNVQPHRMHAGKDGLNQFVIVFDPYLVWSGAKNTMDYKYIKAFANHSEGFCNKISRSDEYFNDINNIIFEIKKEYTEKVSGWQLMIKAKLLILLTLLYRHFKPESTEGSKRKALLRLRPVIHHIEENYKDRIFCSDMAKIAGVTSQHFSAVFKESMGETFTEYVNSKRLESVKKQLVETEKPVTRIAYDCGFNNLSYFNKLFLSKTGLSPSEYRKQSQGLC